MPPFLQDALDLARFRVKALDHYAYDWWQPVLWLTLLGLLPALIGGGKPAEPAMIGLLLGLSWVSALIITFYFGWWLKKDRAWSGQGSLFPLVVLASSSQLLGPLLDFVPDPVLPLAVFALLAYQFCVLVTALARSTGVSRRHVLKGFLSYFVTCLAAMLIMSVIAVQAGWLPAPSADGSAVGTQKQEQR